ncbi:arsenate reductase ArsC [Gemmatimonas sp.]|uniref:arsenate reductase ArsC n=1 Tax=Gemmatimonas sp. TaxID=1962908 RepID=UPI0039830321
MSIPDDLRPADVLRVLVLCTRNSARSQIAEALFKTLGRERIAAASAGSDPGAGVHPIAVEVLAEIGIDWQGRPSRAIDVVIDEPWDVVITVCDAARDACPYLPTAGVTAHWGMEDPAAASASHEAQLDAFRHTRDRLGDAISVFLDVIGRARAVGDEISVQEALLAGGRRLRESAPMA